jgi:hypothetical protein
VVMRAVEIVGKMLLDNECSGFQVALGVAISAAGSRIMLSEMEKDHGTASISATIEMSLACQDISDTVREWLNEPVNNDLVIARMNEHIARANKAHEAEQKLPKGT